MLPILYYMPVSPWSLKARCALRLRKVQVEERVYVPLVGEPALRLRMARFSGRVTVPVLFTDEGVLSDSFDIARYAERHGEGPSLIAPAHAVAVEAFNASSERLLNAGRMCSMLRVAEDPAAALESLPRTTGKLLGQRGARAAVSAFNAKYGISHGGEIAATANMRHELMGLRAALSDGRAYLLGDFSYADVAMALGLQLVMPLPDSPMEAASQRAATHEVLAAEFADLLAWRDAVHANHGLLPVKVPARKR
jgi:glutathione S-transferase